MWISAKIGIGANLGDARSSVVLAISKLACLPETRLMAQSSLYLTAPIDSIGDDYVNAVVSLETRLTADTLLQALQELELAFGRERPYRNAPRTLDLDVLLYGDKQINSASLTVPHPRMTERAFVLLPLLQIDPQISIPGLGKAQQFIDSVAHQAIVQLP